MIGYDGDSGGGGTMSSKSRFEFDQERMYVKANPCLLVFKFDSLG